MKVATLNRAEAVLLTASVFTLSIITIVGFGTGKPALAGGVGCTNSCGNDPDV